MPPWVLVSTPTYAFHGYCLDLYVEHLRALDYPRFDTLLVDNSEGEEYVRQIRGLGVSALHVARKEAARPTMIKCRNLIRRVVLDCGYDYLLFLDQDVFAPPHALSRLLAHRLPVVSGVYTKWALGRRWALAALREWLPTQWSEPAGCMGPAGMVPVEELPPEGILPVYGAGHGCLLIARAVLERIRFRYDPEYDNDSDVYFALDVRAAGWPFHLDTGVRCHHFSVVKDYLRWKKAASW